MKLALWIIGTVTGIIVLIIAYNWYMRNYGNKVVIAPTDEIILRTGPVTDTTLRRCYDETGKIIYVKGPCPVISRK